MKLIRALLALGVALGLEVVLGRLFPVTQRYVDFMLIPVVWYGLAGSQRSGMLVGCLSGLIQDSWFELYLLGLNGFKRTFLGYVLGGMGTRFDLNHPMGRFVGGALASVADSLMDIGLRRLLDQQQTAAGGLEILIRGLTTGVVLVLVFAVLERFGRRGRGPGLGRSKSR